MGPIDMTPTTLDEIYRYLHLDLPLTRVQCLSIDQIKELVRQTWHFAIAAERARAKAEAKNTPTDRRP